MIPAAILVSGSSGLTHEHSAAIDEAAAWLSTEPVWPAPIIPAARSRFGVFALEACQAISQARKTKAARGTNADGFKGAASEGSGEATSEAAGGQGYGLR